ncbi:hypothetical protein [Actinoplanes sp. GCM10030250]|uniref:hypothetical protein n=1 Tax=Actinoplanes sp. GCM10030250 TaxID=3273376 RepID=UPI00360BD741
MTRDSVPDPFTEPDRRSSIKPRPIIPVPASMSGETRGRRVLIGLPGNGWRGDLRADNKVVQGSRTYIPIMAEGEWYRAETEQSEVFAPLIPIERVWVEDLGIAIMNTDPGSDSSLLASLDEPPRRNPANSLDTKSLTGRRVVEIQSDGSERRDLRAVTELFMSDSNAICARVARESEWYQWTWSGKIPRTMSVPAHFLWVE